MKTPEIVKIQSKAMTVENIELVFRESTGT